MILNSIWWWSPNSGDLECYSTPSLPLLPGPLLPELVALVQVSCMGQIDPLKKVYVFEQKTLKKQQHKNINMNVQWMWFSNI